MSDPDQIEGRGHHHRHAPTSKYAVWVPIALASIVVFFVIVAVWHRVRAGREQRESSKKAAQLSVNVVLVKRDKKPKELILPGNVQAFQETILYPRANGYVKKWNVDIGDNVEEGQLLAEIETPEIDQQLSQAKASYDLADATATRWRELASKQVVSEQDRDEKETAKRTSQANLEQIAKTQGFQKITAPFAGKITARRVDVGALVSPSTQLFGIAQTDPLRVYVYVPQTDAGSLKPGLLTKILVQERPGQNFDGTVMRTAGAIDSSSRTMQVEVEVPNHEGKLFSGMYAEVKFSLPEENAPIVIPANTVMFRSVGPQVATVTNENKIHWTTIRVGRDFGTKIEALEGLKEDEKAVMNPTDDLQEGIAVEVKAPEKEKPKADSSASSAAN
jgi:RND family efflux transporter MFP subunit